MRRGEKKPHQAGVRLDEKTMAAVLEEADREGRPLAAMLRILVREALETREGKRRKKSSPPPTRRAEIQVRAGPHLPLSAHL